MILAGDVGATKILLEVGSLRSGTWEPRLARRYESGEVSFAEALEAFLDEWETQGGLRGRITAAAFGAAGPVSGNKVKMTNRPWSVDGDIVIRRFHIPRVRVVNDLAASAYGLDLLSSRDLATIQPGKVDESAPRVVMGVGTGLGVAFLVPCADRLMTIAGEGGHAGFAPATVEQADLWRSIQKGRGRVSVEDVVSGTGLTRIYEYMASKGDCATPSLQSLLPEHISQAAIERGDPMCGSALELFVECIGSVAGDHAVSLMARGGVYLTGGIVAKILPQLKAERFRAAFCAKGAHSALLQRIPVRAVTSERLPVLGAARFAADKGGAK